MRGVVSIPSSQSSEHAGLAQVAMIKSLAALGRGGSSDLAQQYGSARVQKAVSAMTTGNAEGIVDWQIIISAFIQQMRNQSAFYRMLDSMVRIPFRTHVSLMVADANAWIVGEGKPIPVTRGTIEQAYIKEAKAASIVVLSEELLRTTQSEQNLTRALRRAIAATVDRRFFGLVIDEDTPTIASAGTDAAAAVADIKALLDAVEPTTESVLFLSMDPKAQRHASMLTTASGDFLFPDLTPTGGAIRGIPALPSDGIGEGRVALFDAIGFIGQAGEVDIDASGQADVEMLAANLEQDGATGAGTQLVSMFQTNSVAIRAIVDFAAERLIDNAVAVLEGVAWGEEV